MTRPIVGWLLAALSTAMLALIFGEFFSPINATTFGVHIVASDGAPIIASVLPGAAFRAGVRRGDRVDVAAMSLGDRLRLEIGYSPVGTAINVPIEHGGQTRLVSLVSQTLARTRNLSDIWPYLLSGIITLCVVGIVGFRKPSVATAFLVWFGMGAATTHGIVGLFSWLTGGWFTVTATFILAAFSTLPLVALLPFIVRFPEPPTTQSGRSLARAADAIFSLSAIVFTIQTVYEPVLFESWPVFNYATLVGSLAVVLIFTTLVCRRANGEVRGRIGWVVVGIVISAVGTIAFNYFDSVVATTGEGGAPAELTIAQLLSCALPLSLGYAILRHRVIDVGFVVNRTVVYGVMLAIVLAFVGLVDWLASRLIDQQRFAVALEAILTIGFGFALNWLHAKLERLIDRVVFRARHIAEKRVEYRIGALGFAASGAAIDEALAVEAPSILGLSSAAVFRRVSDIGAFQRTAAVRWGEETSTNIDEDSLLVRTLRSLERSVILEDVAVTPEGAPTDRSRPTLAIPIITQHELTGFVLYGNRLDGALPDPEEISLLNRLCVAASGAYGAVEARQWRDRAAALERSLASSPGIAEATPI